MEVNITKKEFKQALEDGNVVIVGCRLTRNGWTEFNVYIVKHRKKYPGTSPFKRVIVPEAGYYATIKAEGDYKCIAWGTDRRLEIILSIGYALGLKFNEIEQNYQWLQG